MISIIIPAWNAEATLARTLDSLLAQTDAQWEAVVVNDGSTDGTLEVAIDYAQRDSRIKAQHQANGGTASALNAAVRRSTGEFLAQLGADDELLPEFIASSQRFIRSYPDYDIYASNAVYCQASGETTPYHSDARFSQVMSLSLADEIRFNQIYGTAVFRRSFYDLAGGFREDIFNEDYDFWLRIMMQGARHIYQPEVLAIYHVRAGQKTSNGLLARQSDLEVLRDLVDVSALSSQDRAVMRARIKELGGTIRQRRILYALLGQQRSERLIGWRRSRRQDASS